MSGTSPWFIPDDTGAEPAAIWVDHHRQAHKRDTEQDGWTLCEVRVIGANAPTHAHVSVVGCRNCAARSAARRQHAAVA
ncbi:hypothetical protein [Saccharopolyspora hattusasensis]|uniref:hypothetical protein n=1 Tax=Saccharopolyspora hattusasensis TaxID=1128679 RepID=UPI003D9641FF